MLNEFSPKFFKTIHKKNKNNNPKNFSFDIKNFFYDKQKYVHKLDIKFITLFADMECEFI